MPEAELATQQAVNLHSHDFAVRETRFDPPHEIARGDVAEKESGLNDAKSFDNARVNAAALDLALAESGDGPAIEAIQQFRAQAAQLAEHLTARQAELDCREAELNARLAQHETSTRNARLWFQEQQHDLADQTLEIARREEMLASQLAAMKEQSGEDRAANHAVLHLLEQSSAMLEEGDGALRELELERRRLDIESRAEQLEHLQDECKNRQAILSERERHLEKAEQELIRGEMELNAARAELETDREEQLRRFDGQRCTLANEDQRQQIELKKQREAIAQRSQFLERRAASLDQLRAELLRLQRETLEMRLATEELWGQMSGSVPTAAVTQSLARLRAKLAEHYRLQAADIAAQQKELEELAERVAGQHQQIGAQRRELDVWIAHQQTEIESQAARLVAREQELDREQERIRQQRLQWETNRRKLEAEIRRLQQEVRRAEIEPAMVEA